MGNEQSGPGKGKRKGWMFWKKPVVPEPKEPIRSVAMILASTEARERIVTAIKMIPPGTSQRWKRVLDVVNRYTMPTEEEPDPLNIETNLQDMKNILRRYFEDVKFISSDGLALARQFIPDIYDKHTVERCRHVAQRERDERFLTDESYAYGEVDFEIFATMYLKIVSVFGQQEKGTFYDLGCGVGQLVYTAAFIGNFKRVIGVEYLNALITRAEKRQHRWDVHKLKCPQAIQDTAIEWVEDDFVDNPFWTGDATFIFLHWTAFSWEHRNTITRYLRRCPEGTHVVTFTFPIQCSDDFEIFLVDTCDTSWGKAEFYFHEKISPPQTDATFTNITPMP